MLVQLRGKFTKLLKIDFVRFCIVGGTGFLINLGILVSLTRAFSFNVFFAQLIGAEIALFSNFILHHHWTYNRNKVKKSIPTLILQFHASSWPAIIGSSVMVSVLVGVLHINKIEALVISSAVALAWNFVWSKYVIWRDVNEKEIEEIVE